MYFLGEIRNISDKYHILAILLYIFKKTVLKHKFKLPWDYCTHLTNLSQINMLSSHYRPYSSIFRWKIIKPSNDEHRS